MSTVKITDLPAISTINSNTANTVLVGVDIPTNITGKITLTTLAAGLFSNNNLVVGNNHTVLPNVVAQFTGNSGIYSQVNTENINPNGSADYVITADDGTDTDFYLDMGLNGSTFSDPTSTYSATKAHDGYLYVASSGTNKGNLIIGTTNSTGKVNFVVGGLQTQNIVGYIDSTGIWSNSINSVVSANAASANAVINARISANVATLRGEISGNVTTLNASITANSTSDRQYTDAGITANVATLRGEITSNIATQNTFTQEAFNKANNALANTNNVVTAGNITVSNNITVQGNVFITGLATSSVDSPVLFLNTANAVSSNISAFTYNNANSSMYVKNGVKFGTRTLGTVSSATINFTNDALVRCNISGTDLTLSLTGYDAGKTVTLWVTNIASGTRTINHGCLAQNSTSGTTSFSLPANESIRIAYMSFDGDNANTYVSS